MSVLEIKNLHATIEDEEDKKEKEILKGVDLTIKSGEIHAIMGPNGTGKSTLSETIMGNPKYKITKGSIKLDQQEISKLSVDQRARAGLFLAMQYPISIKGISNIEFIRSAVNTQRSKDQRPSTRDFITELKKKQEFLEMDSKMSGRYLNEGFSGGEKKRNEILQMMMIKPKFAILDEIDSGLDIDNLKVVAKGVNSMLSDNFGLLMITHYQRLLNYIKPDFVHIMYEGKIIKSGDANLALKVEKEGYHEFENQKNSGDQA